MRAFLVSTFMILCLLASIKVEATNLPPKKPLTKENALGEGAAVVDPNRLSQDSPENTETSGAIAPVIINSKVIQDLRKNQEDKVNISVDKSLQEIDSIPVASVGEASTTPEVATTESRYWMVFPKKPELAFISGWAFTHKDLAALAGSGFAFGVMGAQEINERMQIQFRLSASHHAEDNSSRQNRLWIIPMEVLVQFTKKIGNFIAYVQPGLGTAAWFSESTRTVDLYSETSHGYDFMASGGIGVKYTIPEMAWTFGADYSLSYISGYFDNYLSRIMLYSSYQF